MTARVVETLPEGPEWLHEVKFDGYRALLLKQGSHVQVRSRNNKTLSYSEVESAAKRLKVESVVLDGEIVAIDEKGHPSFQALQHRSAHARHAIVFYAFDVLHLNGEDLTGLPLHAAMRYVSVIGTADQIPTGAGRSSITALRMPESAQASHVEPDRL